MTDIAVDGDRVWRRLQTLSEYTSTPGQGVTRLSFTAENMLARQQLVEWMNEAGLEIGSDEWGNLYGILRAITHSPAVMVGSHIDSVPHGGAFDGVLGVLAGLECLSALRTHTPKLRRSVVLAVFAEEEGSRFGGTLAGSRAAVGMAPREVLLATKDASGRTYQEASSAAVSQMNLGLFSGFDLDIEAVLELHIEQGAVLEQEGTDLGVVTAIAGIHQYLVQLTGTANHAGATPMPMRRDALAAAAEIVAEVEKLPDRVGSPDTVATVGHLVVIPNATNVIPSQVNLSIDLRDPDGEVLQRCDDFCRRLVHEVASRRSLNWSMTERSFWEPVTCHPRLVEKLERACLEHGFSHRRIVSGAIHDAGVLAKLAPVGVLFVPSRQGRSHCPEEWSSPEAVRQGTVILHRVLANLTLGEDIDQESR